MAPNQEYVAPLGGALDLGDPLLGIVIVCREREKGKEDISNCKVSLGNPHGAKARDPNSPEFFLRSCNKQGDKRQIHGSESVNAPTSLGLEQSVWSSRVALTT